MNTLMMIGLTTMTLQITQSVNPVKVVFSIMMLSALMFLWMALQTGSFWFPLIFFLLFMGGVMIMFLILSSLLPNEKSWKTKTSVISLSMMICLYFCTSPASNTQKSESLSLVEAKQIMNSSTNLIFMTLVILLYFLIFVSMLSSEKSPLRILLCCLKKVL